MEQERISTTERLTEEMLGRIQRGEWAVEQPIPSERTLIEAFGREPDCASGSACGSSRAWRTQYLAGPEDDGGQAGCTPSGQVVPSDPVLRGRGLVPACVPGTPCVGIPNGLSRSSKQDRRRTWRPCGNWPKTCAMDPLNRWITLLTSTCPSTYTSLGQRRIRCFPHCWRRCRDSLPVCRF